MQSCERGSGTPRMRDLRRSSPRPRCATQLETSMLDLACNLWIQNVFGVTCGIPSPAAGGHARAGLGCYGTPCELSPHGNFRGLHGYMTGAAKDVRLGVVGVGIMGSNHARVL